MQGNPVPGRMQTIQGWRGQAGPVAAIFPIHYPRPLLRSFGFLPVEVWGPPQVKAAHGSAHIQPYVCSVVHNALSFLQSGGLEVADLLLVPHACDALQGLGSILLDFIQPRQPVLTLYIPRGSRSSDVDFLADELRALHQRLQDITGRTPSPTELLECIRIDEEADGLLAQLHQKRLNLPLSDLDFYRLVRSREYLPAERFTALARQALRRTRRKKPPGIPLLLSGILPEPMGLFTALAGMGGRVAADDFACCGRRLYPAGHSEEPFRRMAERIVHAPPDPARGVPIQQRIEHLLGMTQAAGARGAVFYIIKFCEPELYDLPHLRHALRQAGLPSITIEVELNDGLSQPNLNRLAAFLEMLA